ncbi:MAG: ribosome biogenesis factor YjgA [Nannocystaceae bacterium]|nr:DUF615 domain-containing protein [bacterium]
MSLPPEDEPPTQGEPGADAPAAEPKTPKRLSPSEMFPQEEQEAPPDVFDLDVRRSHRAHKEQVDAFARLAKDLVALDGPTLTALGLEAEPRQAIESCRSMRKGARVRELRRIATMLRHVDARALRDRLDDLARGDRAEVQREKEREQWRERLLEGGDAVLSEFVTAYPDADRQQLRQLIRAAGKDRTKGKAVAAYRKLLREIRALDGA